MLIPFKYAEQSGSGIKFVQPTRGNKTPEQISIIIVTHKSSQIILKKSSRPGNALDDYQLDPMTVPIILRLIPALFPTPGVN